MEQIEAKMSTELADVQGMFNQGADLASVYGVKVLGGILLLIAGLYVAKWVQSFTEKGLKKLPKIDETLTGFFSSCARYFIIIITVLMVLSQFGVQTTSLIAVFGAASLAIGLALQGTLSGVAAGVMLLIFRPFKVGDFVEAGGVSGTVKEVNLFFTRVHTSDNVRIVVPNGDIWGKAVKNFSANTKRRIDITVGIGYEDSIDKAVKAIEGILKKENRVDTENASSITVASLGASSVDLSVKVWCKRTDFAVLKSDLQKNIKEVFEKKGINIPYQTQTLHVVQDVIAKEKAA